VVDGTSLAQFENSLEGIGKQRGERTIMREKHTAWLDLEHYADVPLFNTKAVVQQTGIGAPTLRAWERRYMLLSPERAHNDYRLYSERDIAIIRWLKDRVDAGMSISQAIALFRHLEQEHNQLHRKDLPSKSTSPSQMMLSSRSTGEHQPIVEGDEQEANEQVKEGASQPVLQNVQKLDAEMMANISPTTYSMRFVQERLLEAFNKLDEAAASRLMASMLAIYPIEQVFNELITPTLWEIGRLWEQGLITVSIEHFGSAFFHGLLTNLFHAMPSSNTDPLVIVCCAPGEVHELAPLMLSLLLRRAGLRVAYLQRCPEVLSYRDALLLSSICFSDGSIFPGTAVGQSIETNGLLQTVRQLSPALIRVSVTLISFLEAVTELGQKLQELPPPRPILIFGGQVFEQHADLIARVPGIYINGDMQTIITQLRRMAFQQVEDKNRLLG
jgi:MerR family transcriptional regulator, light-induced transcriptional regulator